MYLGQFFDPNLMIDLADETQAYQEALDTGPVPEETAVEPAPTPAPAKAGMSPVTMLLIGGVLLWLVFKK
jgi:hypothetical protein